MNTQQLLLNLLSGCIIALVMWLLNRKKTKAEILFNSTAAYTNMLNSLQKQIDAQADQIKSLEEKVQSYLDLITNYQRRETEYIAQINHLQNENEYLRNLKNEKTKKPVIRSKASDDNHPG